MRPELLFNTMPSGGCKLTPVIASIQVSLFPGDDLLNCHKATNNIHVGRFIKLIYKIVKKPANTR